MGSGMEGARVAPAETLAMALIDEVTELSIAESWIFQNLAIDPILDALFMAQGSTDAEARIWPGIAPSGTPEPYIIAAFQGGRDVNALGSGLARIFSRPQYQVVAMGPSVTAGKLSPFARRIDARLHGKAGTILDDDGVTVLGRILSCVRVRPFSLPETVEGRPYRRLGGLYELQVKLGS